MSVTKINTTQEYEALEKSSALLVTHFTAPWAPQCQQVQECLEELARQTTGVTYCSVEAEELAAVSQRLAVAAVPTVVATAGGAVRGRVDGARPAQVAQLVTREAARPPTAPSASPTTSPTTTTTPSPTTTLPPSSVPADPSDADLRTLLHSAPVLLFMKGCPAEPRCGFSRTTVALLKELNAHYASFDILQHEGVRQRLKEFSQWPTYPQLYVKGELVGGLDILKEMKESGELAGLLAPPSLEGRLGALVRRSPLMLFMKGDRAEPRCGFSRSTVALLNETGLEYDTFDILSDDQVRQGLKTFSNWPTYPQVYVKGELVGGLDTDANIAIYMATHPRAILFLIRPSVPLLPVFLLR